MDINSLATQGFAEGANFFSQNVQVATGSTHNLWAIVIVGLALIVATIILLFLLKKIMENSILGVVIWAASIFIFQVQLPLFPSFVVSVIFGPAGIGTMLLLYALGILTI
ncbi:MAG: hypothetical protein AABW59_02030 [archaeon]